jgi:hypothetical protein
MGSSDPLPTGFKIRFGSLNFQATRNGYVMRITNHTELHPWQSIGPGPVPITPATTPPRPLKRMPWALSRPDTGGTLASVRARREWSNIGPRTRRHKATHPPARQRRPRGSAWPPSRSSPTGCVMPRQPTLRAPAPTWRRTRIYLATTCWRSETSSPPPTTSRTMARPASCPPRPCIGTRSATSPVCRTR